MPCNYTQTRSHAIGTHLHLPNLNKIGRFVIWQRISCNMQSHDDPANLAPNCKCKGEDFFGEVKKLVNRARTICERVISKSCGRSANQRPAPRSARSPPKLNALALSLSLFLRTRVVCGRYKAVLGLFRRLVEPVVQTFPLRRERQHISGFESWFECNSICL